MGCRLGLGVALPYYKHRDMYLMCKNNSLSGEGPFLLTIELLDAMILMPLCSNGQRGRLLPGGGGGCLSISSPSCEWGEG